MTNNTNFKFNNWQNVWEKTKNHPYLLVVL